METMICPFCGNETTEAVCPRCFAEIPHDTAVPDTDCIEIPISEPEAEEAVTKTTARKRKAKEE